MCEVVGDVISDNFCLKKGGGDYLALGYSGIVEKNMDDSLSTRTLMLQIN